MGAMASQITSLTIVYSTVYSGADQRKNQISASPAFVWEIHQGTVNSPHKWPVTRKMFPFDDVIMWGLGLSGALRTTYALLLVQAVCSSCKRKPVIRSILSYSILLYPVPMHPSHSTYPILSNRTRYVYMHSINTYQMAVFIDGSMGYGQYGLYSTDSQYIY